MTAAGGATSSGYTCAGAAGTFYTVNGTWSNLVFDNSDGSSHSSTCTPFPPDLSGVQLSQLNISRKACVDLRQAQKNNDVRAICMDLDESSKVTGDSIVIDTSDVTVRGQITGTSALWLHNAQAGAGVVTAHTGSSMTCSSCALKMSFAESDVTLGGTMSGTTVEIKCIKGLQKLTHTGTLTGTTVEITGFQKLTHTGSLTATGSQLTIAAETASLLGTVRCTGSACSSLVSVNQTLKLGGSLLCTAGKCTLSMRSGGDITSTATISCSGNNQCLLDVASDASASFGGSIAASDIRMVIAESLRLQGTVSTNGQGYAEVSGDGKGGKSSFHSSTNSFRVSGSGGGHGGNGAAACYRYTSYGNLPAGNHAML